MPDSTTIISAAITIIATSISHKLRDSTLPARANATIALVSLLVLLGLMFWLTTDLSPDLKHDAIVLLGLFVSGIAGGKELLSLWQIFGDSPSPLVPPPATLRRPPVVPSKGVGNGD